MNDRPERLRSYPGPDRPLEYWLSPELARLSPPEARSRLRELADAQGTLTAAWGAGIGGGVVFILTGIFIMVMGGGLGPFIALGLFGAGLLVGGILGCRRVRSRLPKTRHTLITRGPGSARGGISMIVFFGVVLGAVFGYGAFNGGAREGSTVAALIGAYILIMLFLVACLLVPSTIMGRSRASFRRKVQSNAQFRALLEEDLLTWRDPVGNASYGPL
ncbi:hypothetical protein [Amycolatopsis sp. NPDC057786]|uniref:hypothetical protein n=1 Tax=Amycolatopsis sp. NPDC057786 TaxID=3346250 RepID=UPI00366B37FA